MSDHTGPVEAAPTAGGAWRSHPWLSRAVRACAFGVPVLTALLVSIGLTRHLPRPMGATHTLLWWAVVTLVTVAVVAVVERAAHRLLPLAALLNLSMIFPDQAPRRFRVARHLGRPADIRRRIEVAQSRGVADTETETMQSVLELATALSIHDRRTRGHSERVRVFTDMLADQMHLPVEDRARLRWASLLHDIGKLRVSHDILNKPGRPSDEEWEELQRHPEEGARLAGPIVAWLGEWGDAIAQHHERWDGTGYPNRLAGEQICLGARIVAVADAFETMTVARAYKRPLSPEAARRELVRCSGTQFDPAVVRAFLEISLGKVGRGVGISAWVAQVPALTRVGPMLQQAGTTVASAVGAAAVTAGVAVGAVQTSPTLPPVVSATAVSRPTTVAAVPDAPSAPGATSAPPSTSPGGQPSLNAPSPGGTPGAIGTQPTGPATGAPLPTDPATGLPVPAPVGTATPTGGPTPPSTGSPTPPPTATATPTPPPDIAPTVVLGSTSATEGSAHSWSASFSDPDSSSWSASVDYGDGSPVTAVPASGGTVTLSHTFARWGSYSVTVTVTDGSGASGSSTAPVTVSAVAPSFTLPTTTVQVSSTKMLNYTGTFTDPGAGPWSGTVTLKNGAKSATGSVSFGSGSFTLTTGQLAGGTWTVTVTLSDGSAQSTGTMTIKVP